MTIIIRSARLFSNYLGKTIAKQEEAIASTSDCSCVQPMPLSPDAFLVVVGRPIVQYGGLDGRVHFNDGEFSSGLLTRFDRRR